MNREQIEAEVRARRQTPAWAEQQVEARGEEPFAPIHRPWSYWADEGKWPINFAVLWLSCESPEDAAKHWSRLRFWGRHVWRDVEDWHQPQHDLGEYLRSGRLVAWAATDSMGDFVEIPRDHWSAGLFWETDRDFTVAVMPDGVTRWRDVCVEQADMVRLWSKTRSRLIDDPEQAFVDTGHRQERLNELARGYAKGLVKRRTATNKDPGAPDEYPFQEALERDLPGPISRDTEAEEAWRHYRFNKGPGRPKRSAKLGRAEK